MTTIACSISASSLVEAGEERARDADAARRAAHRRAARSPPARASAGAAAVAASRRRGRPSPRRAAPRRRRCASSDPACPGVCAIGTMPSRLTRPTVGFRPTRPQIDAGETIEPSVSVPTPSGARLAAIAAAVPELEPLGVAVERVGIARQAAARAPAAGRARRADVGPLAQVGLAEDHGAGVAQPLDDVGVARRAHAVERERAGASCSCGRRSRCCP